MADSIGNKQETSIRDGFPVYTAIGKLASAADIDPIRIKAAYQGRAGLLKERYSSANDGAKLGGIGLVAAVPSAIVMVSDGAEAAVSHNPAKLPTTSMGILLVSAFMLAAGFKLVRDAVRAVKADVEKYAPPNDSPAPRKTALEIGDFDDCGIYVGLSAENGKPLHAALADLLDYKTYEEALAAAKKLEADHPTAHVPTPKELDKNLFANRNAGYLRGTFNTSGSYPASVYRSSASYSEDGARVQWFVDGGPDEYGKQDDFSKDFRLPVRLVW